jgi:hypothetical protein
MCDVSPGKDVAFQMGQQSSNPSPGAVPGQQTARDFAVCAEARTLGEGFDLDSPNGQKAADHNCDKEGHASVDVQVREYATEPNHGQGGSEGFDPAFDLRARLDFGR